jgi:hypothetical protein
MKKLTTLTLILSLSVFGIRFNKNDGGVGSEEKSITNGQNRLFEPDQGSISNVVKQANTAEVALATMTESFESFDKTTGQMTFKMWGQRAKILGVASLEMSFLGANFK